LAEPEHRRRPLADRMRPRTLDEFVGQGHIVGPGRLLRRAIQADQLSSVIFHGPPGTGKTTLARVIANSTEAHFAALNAVLAGVADLRKAVVAAEARREGMFGQRTILFVDEVHRFNKAQQDALLPWVENGTVTLIGATTENPFFEVNKALVSRSRVFQLVPLTNDDLRAVALAALRDAERGYGALNVDVEPRALEHLVDVSNGDARALLNALELAVETTEPDGAGAVRITLPVAEESIQRRAVLYDKEGDAHYDAISAFIKSVRGSDPDAALYWLARMVYAGEDPRFIFRRMLILASEDVGLADPAAVTVVAACAQAFEYVGLPEGQFHLAEAALYLAVTAKSNTALGYFDALDSVRSERTGDVPTHLKDGNRDGAAFGHGAGYLYPHSYREHWVAQQYLPSELQGRAFYSPSASGWEGDRRAAVLRRRESQLAAMLEGDVALAEGLTWSGQGAHDAVAAERWLARAAGGAAARLAAQRDRLMDAAGIRRHHRVLAIDGASGLLAFEAARRAPEGGVWVLVPDAATADALIERMRASGAASERDIAWPAVLAGSVLDLGRLMDERGEGDVRFDAVVGRGLTAPVVGPRPNEIAAALAAWLEDGCCAVMLEPQAALGSAPSEAAAWSSTDASLRERVGRAEAAVLADQSVVGAPADVLADALRSAGLQDVTAEVLVESAELRPTPALIERLAGDSPYARGMAGHLDPADLASYRDRLERSVLAGPGPRSESGSRSGEGLPWRVAAALVAGRKPAARTGD